MLSNDTMTRRFGGSPPKLTILPPRARYFPPYGCAVAGSFAMTALSAWGFVTIDSAMKYAGVTCCALTAKVIAAPITSPPKVARASWIVMRFLPKGARIVEDEVQW